MRDPVDHTAIAPVRRKDTGTAPGFSSKKPQNPEVFQVAVSDQGVYPWEPNRHCRCLYCQFDRFPNSGGSPQQ